MNFVFLIIPLLLAGMGICHHGCDIKACTLNLQRIFRQGFFLNGLNILIHTVGKGKDQCDSDNSDRTGKGGQNGSRLFGTKIIKAQRQ